MYDSSQSPVFKIFEREDTAPVHTADVCCHSFSHLPISDSFTSSFSISLCSLVYLSFSNYFPIFRFTGLLDECINVEVALADMPVVFTHTKHYLSKILWQVWCTIHDSVPPFVLMVCWQGIHPLDICPVCSFKCFIFSIMVPPTSKSEN